MLLIDYKGPNGRRGPMARTDSMFSAFRLGPADADCVISIEYYSELLNRLSKNGKSWHGENTPIIIQIEKAKLSVYFRRARTSKFSD